MAGSSFSMMRHPSRMSTLMHPLLTRLFDVSDCTQLEDNADADHEMAHTPLYHVKHLSGDEDAHCRPHALTEKAHKVESSVQRARMMRACAQAWSPLARIKAQSPSETTARC